MDDNFVNIETVIQELERDMQGMSLEPKEKKAIPNKKVILEILGRAADEHKFLARMAEDPTKALKEYDLSGEEKAALASGDLKRLESWVGKLDKRLCTWPWCRLQQENW